MNYRQHRLAACLSTATFLSLNASENSTSASETIHPRAQAIISSIDENSLVPAELSNTDMQVVEEAASSPSINYVSNVQKYTRQKSSYCTIIGYKGVFHRVKNATLYAEQDVWLGKEISGTTAQEVDGLGQITAAISVPYKTKTTEFPASTAYFSLMKKFYDAQQKLESKAK